MSAYREGSGLRTCVHVRQKARALTGLAWSRNVCQRAHDQQISKLKWCTAHWASETGTRCCGCRLFGCRAFVTPVNEVNSAATSISHTVLLLVRVVKQFLFRYFTHNDSINVGHLLCWPTFDMSHFLLSERANFWGEKSHTGGILTDLTDLWP